MMDEQPLNPESAGDSAPSGSGFPAEPERYPFWTYGDVFLFVGLAVPCMLLAWAMVKGALAILRVHSTAAAVEPVAEQFALYLMLFGALTLIFRVQYDRPFWRSLAWTRLRLSFLWVVIFGVAAAYLVAILGQLIHTPTTKNTMTELMEDRNSLLLMTVYGVTLGPLCEELAFRGFLQPLLARSMGAVLGIVLTTLPFGLLHYWEYGKSWRHAVMVAVAGAAFGWMRHATGSTKASTLMHASYNGLFFVATLAQRKDLIR
jgi:membrane protease YdiL (CAAX protease family)